MCKRIALFAIITIALFICIPAFAQHFLGAFSGAELQVDTQIESPAQNNNAKTLPEQQAGDTIRFQLFVPAGAGQTTNGYALELDLPGKTFSSSIGTVSGRDWTGAALVSRGSKELSALFVTGATIPSTGYLGQVDLQVTRALEDGATLIVKSMSLTSGRDVDQLDVSNAVITFTAPSASTCPGDFDGNGSVDIADFLSFVDVYGSSSSDATYNAEMDLDSNGRVDIADFLSFIDVYGTECGDGSGGSGGGSSGGSSNAITREAFEKPRLLAGGYAQIILGLSINSVHGGPELFSSQGFLPVTNKGYYGNESGMLLAKVKGCAFAANESDRKSKVYIKARRLGTDAVNFKSETVCGAQSIGRRSSPSDRITHLLFFDETSPTNMREAVYNDATGQYDIRVIDSLPTSITGTIYFSKGGWQQFPANRILRLNLDGLKDEILIDNHPRFLRLWDGVSLDVNGGKIYWGGISLQGMFKIQRANLNGSNLEDLVAQEGHFGTLALDVNRGKMYWTNNNRIYRANLDGSNVEVFSLDNAYSIAVGRDKIYYSSQGGLKRINPDGSGIEVIGSGGTQGLVVDTNKSKLYKVNHQTVFRGGKGSIDRMNLDGSEVERLYTNNSRSIWGIAVDSKQGKIYWSEDHNIQEDKLICAELNGDNPQVLYIYPGFIRHIALDVGR